MAKSKKQLKPIAPPDFLPACRKVGKGVALSFIRQIRKMRDCDEHAARGLFEAAVREGKIRRAGTNGAGDVEFYEV